MDNTSYIALSRQSALWNQMNTVANNLANMNTPGFRREAVMFQEYLNKTPQSDSLLSQKVSQVLDFGMVTDFSEGKVSVTGNPLDVAISGEGFFTIQTEDGVRYTRDGHFDLDSDGQVVNSQGKPLLSDTGEPFFLAPNESDINISGDGTLSTENGPIGRIQVVTFDRLQEMEKVSGGLFTTEQDPRPLERPGLMQRALEGSNVEPIVEMNRMIQVQRAYERAHEMIKAEHERQNSAIDTILRVQR